MTTINLKLEPELFFGLDEERANALCMSVASRTLSDLKMEDTAFGAQNSNYFAILHACAGAIITAVTAHPNKEAIAGAMDATLRIIDAIFGKRSKAGFYFILSLSHAVGSI